MPRTWHVPYQALFATGAVDSATHDEDRDMGDSGGTCVLAPLLWRLCYGQKQAATPEQESPYPLYLLPTINEQTLLFRTLAAHVYVSSLRPDGMPSAQPRDEQLLLPSASTLHLYSAEGTHIVSAWSHTNEFFNEVVAYDQAKLGQYPSASRLRIEIALLAGPSQGDWRIRTEKPTTWEYMKELAIAGLNIRKISSLYEKKLEYEKAIAQTYIAMVQERQNEVANAEGGEMRLTVAFWEDLRMRLAFQGLKSQFPGHSEETLRPVLEGLAAERSGMRAKQGQKFIKSMLIGHLGDGETNGSG
jgi:hypothetical protein